MGFRVRYYQLNWLGDGGFRVKIRSAATNLLTAIFVFAVLLKRFIEKVVEPTVVAVLRLFLNRIWHKRGNVAGFLDCKKLHLIGQKGCKSNVCV